LQVGKVKYSYREIDPQDLQLGTLLGEGGFGKGAIRTLMTPHLMGIR
jgi:hypothetical protein